MSIGGGEIAIIIFSYLLGSIPFGLIIVKTAGLGDIRNIGSGNIGATNVLRAGNKVLAFTTLLMDALKGVVAVLLTKCFSYSIEISLLAALAVVIGHIFPIWLKFKGGKGVATALAVVLAISWQVGVIACLVWLSVFAVFRISSLSSLLSILSTVVFSYVFFSLGSIFYFSFVLAVLIVFTHRANIMRMFRGEELGFKKKEK